MTPQLQQAIKLLQFSSIELTEYIETQLEQNPLLERDESVETVDLPADAADNATAVARSDGEPTSVDTAVSGDDHSISDDGLDTEFYDNVFDGESSGSDWQTDPLGGQWQARGGTFDDHESNPGEMVSGQITLQEHLVSQLAVEIDDPIDRVIGVHLIDMLDESGYLSADIAQIAEVLGCPVERVEAVLHRLQDFDPPGIFARSLAECLALQLDERGLLNQPMQAMLAHLPLIARRDWPALARLCGVGTEKVMEMMARIRSLNPKPASVFDYGFAAPVTPDVIMRAQPGGTWIIELNSETLPRVLVNNHYFTQISRAVRNREEKQFVNECFQSANWLVKSLHQRATTILKVASEIIRQQQAFFVNGVQSLRPLVLRDIADAIGMHESTVSRVTSNKFVATPRGIYELKYFFTHGVGGSSGGEVHSAESVRDRIRKMISAEPPQAILSDDALADALQNEGIDIARRTVAKYREAMRIPSSVQRRREKSGEL